MDSNNKKLLPAALGALGGVAGSVYGYEKTGAYWTWPRFVYSFMGSGIGAALGYTAAAVMPTTNTSSIAGLGAAEAAAVGIEAEMLLPAIEPNDQPQMPLKLRRMEIIRGDQPVVSSPTLKILALSTKQRAKRSNKDLPGIIQRIDRKYRRFVQEAAQLHNVPFEILITKLSIENPDLLEKVVTGGGATGLMQIAPGTASDVLRSEYRSKQLTEVEAAWFAKKLGARLAGILSGARKFTTADLQQPELNLHLGALAIGQYLRKYTDPATGIVYLHKAVAEYNRGGRAEVANGRTRTPDQLIAYKNGKFSTPAVTQQYIMSYCGPAGGLDLLTRHKLATSNALEPLALRPVRMKG